MRYAVAFLVFLALMSVLPEMAAMSHTTVAVHAFSFGLGVRNSITTILRVASSTPQPVWLVGVGIVLILLSWFIRRRISRSTSQGSH